MKSSGAIASGTIVKSYTHNLYTKIYIIYTKSSGALASGTIAKIRHANIYIIYTKSSGSSAHGAH